MATWKCLTPQDQGRQLQEGQIQRDEQVLRVTMRFSWSRQDPVRGEGNTPRPRGKTLAEELVRGGDASLRFTSTAEIDLRRIPVSRCRGCEVEMADGPSVWPREVTREGEGERKTGSGSRGGT